MRDIAIIGGGAAGLAAAVAAGRILASASGKRASKSARITVFEADERVGRSILATGNGRCNFSNALIDPSLYRNADFVREALESCAHAAHARFGMEEDRCALAGDALAAGGVSLDAGAPFPNVAVSFFESLGMLWREEGEGRLYPAANKASVVLDVLRSAASALGVEEAVRSRVDRVEPRRAPDGPLTLRMADGAFERARMVIVACGGKVASSLLPSDLPFEDQRSVLGPLATETALVRQLDNIRVRGFLGLLRNGACVHRERGEVMFRKYGVSGIAAFNLSRLARPGDELSVDFVPGVPASSMPAFLDRRRKSLQRLHGRSLTCEELLRGMVLPQVAHVLLEYAQVQADTLCEHADLDRVAGALKDMRLRVKGIGDERQCQVHRGGFCVESLDAATMASRKVDGLYVAGEALDVDAPCGGYNLHWAWSSGMLAGISAACALAGAPGERRNA